MASGTATVIGVGAVTLTGTVAVQFNNTGDTFDETIAIPGSTNPGIPVVFATTANPQSFALDGGQLGILGQTIGGSFAFSTAGGDVIIAASGVSVSLGGGAVSVQNGTGAFQIGGGGVAGTVSGTVSATVPGVTFGSGFTLTVNTGTAPVNASPTVGGQPVTIDVPAGPYVQFGATNTTLTVLRQTLTGSFSVQVATLTGGGSATTILASGVSLSLGGSGGAIALTKGRGALLVTGNGIAGELTGTIALTVGATTPVSASFDLAINSTTSAVDQTFTVGASTVAVNLPGGPYLEFQATGATITVAGQTLSGNLAVQQATSVNVGAPVLAIGVTGGSLSLGGASPVLTITGATGAVFIEPTGLAGSISATVGLDVPGVTLTGNLALQINTGTVAVSDSITIGQTTVGVTVPAGPYLEVAGTGVRLSILGQTLTGDVTIAQQTGQPLAITVANLAVAFGPAGGAPVLTATQTGGPAQFAISPAGIAGQIAMNVALADVPGLALGGAFALQVNTTSAAAQGLPAGPFVQVSATGATVTIIGQQLSGSVIIQDSTDAAGATVVSIGINGGTLSLAGGAVSVSAISGLLELSRGSIAGTLSASVALSSALTGNAVGLSGTFAVSVNTGAAAVTDSLAVGGTAVAIDVPAGPYMSLQATGATLTVLGQTLSGNFTVRQVTTGPGPDGIPGNADDPQAVEVTITGGSLGLGDGSSDFLSLTAINGDLLLLDTTGQVGIAGQVSAAVALQGIPGVSLSGALRLEMNTTGTAVTAVFQDAGLPTPSQLSLPAGATPASTTPWFEVTGTGVSLDVAGQTLSGNITFSAGGGAVNVTLANVSLGLGDGTTNFVNVTNGAGNLSLATASGLTGQFSGDVAVDVPGVAFAGTLAVQFAHGQNGTTVTVTGSGVTLNIAGQQIGASAVTISVVSATVPGSSPAVTETAVQIAVTDLSLSFGPAGSPYVDITAADALSGAILIDHNGVAASFSATSPASGASGSIFSIPGRAWDRRPVRRCRSPSRSTPAPPRSTSRSPGGRRSPSPAAPISRSSSPMRS